MSETIITGDFGGVVPAGTVARLRGNVRLVDNLHVRGTLVCDPTGVNVDGQNLYDIHTHDGTLNLVGTEKTAWLHWGDTPVGWQVGDRLGVAPMNPGIYQPYETTWQGSWATTVRPAGSPNVTLVDGSIARPEVANLSQTVTLRNLKRVMVHEASAPNPQTFKWIKVLNSGVSGELGMYPVHFHMIGEHARGSVLEGVVVEGGKNHAFVPHGSHGITYTNCVGYNIINDAFWWDDSSQEVPLDNNSNDTTWKDCLVLWVKALKGIVDGVRLTGFYVGSGHGNVCTNNVAAAVDGGPGGNQCSGYHWPSKANDNPGGTVWTFHHNLTHNSRALGYFSWQNEPESQHVHQIEDIRAFNCLIAGIQHGAYVSRYHWRRMVLGPNMSRGIQSRSLPVDSNDDVLFEDFVMTAPFEISHHNSPNDWYVKVRGPVPSVIVRENLVNAGHYVFEDSGLSPAKFKLETINPGTVLILKEGGVETHRWQSGVWS